MKHKLDTHDATTPSNHEVRIHTIHGMHTLTSTELENEQNSRFLTILLKKYQEVMRPCDSTPCVASSPVDIIDGHQLSEEARHYLRYQTLGYRDFDIDNTP